MIHYSNVHLIIIIFFIPILRPNAGPDGGGDDGEEEMEFWPPLSYKNRETEWNEADDDDDVGSGNEDPVDGEHDVDMRVGVEGTILFCIFFCMCPTLTLMED